MNLKKLLWLVPLFGAALVFGPPSAQSVEVQVCQPVQGSTTLGCGIISVTSAAAEGSHILKASRGELYSVYAVNLTATAGFLIVLNSATVTGDGAVVPLDCAVLPASGQATINYRPGPSKSYSTGIVAVVSSSATCFTKTTGVITAFISGDVE